MTDFDINKFRNQFKTKTGMKFKTLREKKIYLLGCIDAVEDFRNWLKGVDEK